MIKTALVVYKFPTPDGWGEGNTIVHAVVESVEGMHFLYKEIEAQLIQSGHTLKGQVVILNIIKLRDED